MSDIDPALDDERAAAGDLSLKVVSDAAGAPVLQVESAAVGDPALYPVGNPGFVAGAANDAAVNPPIPPANDLLRFTSQRLPYRRAGLVFAASRELVLATADVTPDQARELYADPAIGIAFSTDGGETWRVLPEAEVETILVPVKIVKTKR